jgi:hypothetical protein
MDRSKPLNTVLLRPAFAPIDVWCTISGLGRRVTYELLNAGHLKAIKRGASTLIDVDHGIAYLKSNPDWAESKSKAPKKAKKAS